MTLFILTLRSCRSESRKDHLIIFAVFSSKKNKKRKRERERSHQHQRGDLHHGGSATRGEDSQRKREEKKREERKRRGRKEGR